jgi:hypothetical protein
MQMIDVLKRLAELDKANPNRPEYIVAEAQNIPVNISESKQVDECGMMSDMPRPSTPASINMTAGSGEELGDLIRAIGNLTSGHSDHSEMKPLSTTPSLGIASTDGMDMKSMIDKLNDIDQGQDDEEDYARETYDNTPANPTDLNEFDPEDRAHHENPPGAAKNRGLQNHPIAVPTMEQIGNNLMHEYMKFISGDIKK